MGRPSKLTPDVTDRVCVLVRAGVNVDVASAASGISETTFHRWMASGERRAGPHREFRAAVLRARAEAEATLVTRITRAAAAGSWQAAAWLLERGHPERWAKVSERRLLPEDDAPPAPVEDSLTGLDELAAKRAVLSWGPAG